MWALSYLFASLSLCSSSTSRRLDLERGESDRSRIQRPTVGRFGGRRHVHVELVGGLRGKCGSSVDRSGGISVPIRVHQIGDFLRLGRWCWDCSVSIRVLPPPSVILWAGDEHDAAVRRARSHPRSSRRLGRCKHGKKILRLPPRCKINSHSHSVCPLILLTLFANFLLFNVRLIL